MLVYMPDLQASRLCSCMFMRDDNRIVSGRSRADFLPGQPAARSADIAKSSLDTQSPFARRHAAHLLLHTGPDP